MANEFAQITSPPQAQAEVIVNESLEALQHIAVYGYKAATSSGLTWGYYGGAWGGFTVAAGTITLTASSTNYIVAARATGAISVSTTNTNWNNTTDYARVYQVVTGASTVTGTPTDARLGPSGVLAASSGGGSFTGGTLTSPLNEAPQVTLASAATVNIGAAAANSISISGTTAITAFGTIASGAVRRLVFQGALTLTHNATSLILPGGANITTAAGDVAWMESLGSGNWRCVGYHKANGQAVVTSGGGGLTNITESLATASPNNTNNVASLTVTGGTVTAFLALVPKGAGGLLAQVPDGTATAGNARGTRTVDWQMSRSNANQIAEATGSVIAGGTANRVAVGNDYSVVSGGSSNAISGGSGSYNVIAGGRLNNMPATGGENVIGGGSSHSISGTASGNVIAGGFTNSATGSYGAIPGGNNNTVTGSNATAIGSQAKTRGVMGTFVHASGFLSAQGDAQYERYVASISTTNATATAITTTQGGASATSQPLLASNTAMAFRALVVARDISTGDTATWEIKGAIKNVSGTVSLVGTPTVTSLGNDSGASAWTVAAVADNTNKCLRLNATGAASTTIRWVATIDISQVG